MRRSRRGGHHAGLEFGGSGEDSFVAVVVTKLTGALLFILLLTMVIMALLPKAVDLPSSPTRAAADGANPQPEPLTITTPADLPEAIAGRPYRLALAATGGQGPLRWAVDGALPAGLTLEPTGGLIEGTPQAGTAEPVPLQIRVGDGASHARQATRLVVFQPDRPLTLPSRWRPALPPIPWREWVDQGFGFLVLGLVHLMGMNTLAALERRAVRQIQADPEATATPEATADLVADAERRFRRYRGVVRSVSLVVVVGLAVWLSRGPV